MAPRVTDGSRVKAQLAQTRATLATAGIPLPWLDAEIAVVKPHLLVLLGATAAQALLGRDFRVTLQRGQLIERPGLPPMMATVHPSSILRAPDDEARELEMRAFVKDLQRVAQYLQR